MTEQRNVWRNERQEWDSHPTVNSIVICAEDALKTQDIFTLVIIHARTINGPGFIASVRSGGSMHNGEIILGVDETAYNAARARGGFLLEKAIERLDREMKAYNRIERGPTLSERFGNWRRRRFARAPSSVTLR